MVTRMFRCDITPKEEVANPIIIENESHYQIEYV